MTLHFSSNARFVFGPFELDGRTGELRRGGARVRLSGQPVHILLLLASGAGSVVTRDQLREQLWAEGTTVDFEHGLNAAMNKLRRALHDSAERPRFIETVPGRGYRFIGALERLSDNDHAVAGLPESPDGPATFAAPDQLAPISTRWGWRLAIVTASVLGVIAVVWLSGGRPEPDPPWTFTRLTADAGIAADAAVSPDGRLIAYSSDQSTTDDSDPLTGGLDLYVKNVAGGSPVRLTFDGAANRTPDFSPDGSHIVFRSSRDGGGIYEIPALGGTTRRIASDGRDPRYSPDGGQVAYWTGAASVAAAVPGSGEVWIASVAGGRSRRVAATLTTARYPIWSPDGAHLLVVGYTSAKAYETLSSDWWTVATDGSNTVRTGAYEALIRAGLTPQPPGTPSQVLPQPGCWSAVDGQVTFSISTGDSINLWRIEVSARSGHVVGAPQRLTTAGGRDMRPSCAGPDKLVFAQVDVRNDIWSLPLDLDHGRVTGPPERMTHGLRSAFPSPSLTRDGRFMVFTSDQSGPANIWLRDLDAGTELSVAGSLFVQGYAVSNSSGTAIAFSVYENGKRAVYVSAPGGAPARVCSGCLRATDWSHDHQTLVIFDGSPYHIDLLDVASSRHTPLLRHPDDDLLYGRLSPDNRWIVFTRRVGPARGRIMIAPIDGVRPVPEPAWITIADVDPDDSANWSPDGNLLYFTSGRDGFACLWARRLDGQSRLPVGEAFPVEHFHGRQLFTHSGWTAAADRIVLPLAETSGDLWMMSRPPQ